MKKTIIITGTHLTPALAIIRKLQESPEEWQIYYLGRKHTMEADKSPSPESSLLPKEKVKFISIPAGRLQRCFTVWTIPSLLRVPLGFIISLYWLAKIKPDVICSFGGYVSVPVIIAGKLLGIPSLTHEQTATVGLANKINGHFVNRVAITFPDSRKFFPKKKTILTGNPIRPEILQSHQPLYQFFLERPQIYLTGGSQGARILNESIWAILPQITKKYNLIHQCGNYDYPKLQEKYHRLPQKIRQAYFLKNYLESSSVGWALNSDLIISRSGANIILEIGVLGKPAILIPLPKTANNEQVANANFLAAQGGAIIINQKDLSGPKLLAAIEKVMNNLAYYQKKAQKTKRQIKTNAAQRLVEELVKLIK
jgi:UDP-N-acetylglucosamine--N-acetylmuramyl-(pentapeptide) pyrophosphoryl-undecaprenol N-acetylglucosamine transferase